MIAFLNLLALIAISIAGYRASRKSELLGYYWLGLGVKIVAGILVGLLYSQYYANGDSWVMFNEAKKLSNIAFSSPNQFFAIYLKSDYAAISEYAYAIQPRAAFMTKILGLLTILTGQNYWLSACYLSLFSFFGFWLAANTIYKLFKHKLAAVVPTLFFPSIVFWSAGVLKESLAIGSLAGVLAILTDTYYRRSINWLNMFLLLMGLLVVLFLKYYYAAILIVSFTTVYTTRAFLPLRGNKFIEFGALILIFSILMALASLTHPNFWPSRILEVLNDNYYQLHDKSFIGNVVEFQNLSPTVASFLYYSPKALFAGLFYPLWMTSFNMLKLASMLENWLLISAFIYVVRWFKMPKKEDDRLLLWTMILFIGMMAIFITFSTPNFGTLARFKIGYLLVLVTLMSGAISNRLKAR
jgi:hypothetical protein